MLSASELASITATVAKSFDVAMTFKRRVPATDGSGHTTDNLAVTATYQVNVIRPSDTLLQQFAGIIGSQRALLIRYLPSSDIREGDITTYQGLNWRVHQILSAESYTVANDALIVTII